MMKLPPRTPQEFETALIPVRLQEWSRSQAAPMLRATRAAVEIESPSGSKQGVTKAARFFARELASAGAHVSIHRHPAAGPLVIAEIKGQSSQTKPLLLLGHTDTVWDHGALAAMPFRVARGRAYGPGIFDMKAGLVIGVYALRALQTLGMKPRGAVRFFLNPDEETGSSAFRRELLREARGARACLVLEPAAPGGSAKTSRKGVAVFKLRVGGRAAHAGINPGAGVNAVSEMARQIGRIEALARPDRGLTINVGVARGGSRANVVPESAEAFIDVRFTQPRDGVWIDRRMRSLKPVLAGASLEVSGGVNRPPLERRRSQALYGQARLLAAIQGFALEEATTGGGSDGSFAAALGVPTLDGLGAVGDGAHARHEHVKVSELPRRAALLAALLATL